MSKTAHGGTLIAVSDMAKAKHFYETVMEQKVFMDLGVHVAFRSHCRRLL